MIGLLMGDDGIPHTPQQRLAVAHKIRDRAAALGIPAEDIVFDPLMLAVGAEPLAGQVGLETIRLLRAEICMARGEDDAGFDLCLQVAHECESQALRARALRIIGGYYERKMDFDRAALAYSGKCPLNATGEDE